MEAADDVVRGQFADCGAAVGEAGSAAGQGAGVGEAVGFAVRGGCVGGGGRRGQVYGVVDGGEVGCWGNGEGEGCGGDCGEQEEESRQHYHSCTVVLVRNVDVQQGNKKHCVLENGPFRDTILMRVLSHMAEASLARSKAHHACLSRHPRDPHRKNAAVSWCLCLPV